MAGKLGWYMGYSMVRVATHYSAAQAQPCQLTKLTSREWMCNLGSMLQGNTHSAPRHHRKQRSPQANHCVCTT